METHLSRDEIRLTLSAEDVRALELRGRLEGEMAWGPGERRRVVVVRAEEPERRASTEQMSVENEPATDR
jgi:hypothetical protein